MSKKPEAAYLLTPACALGLSVAHKSKQSKSLLLATVKMAKGNKA